MNIKGIRKRYTSDKWMVEYIQVITVTDSEEEAIKISQVVVEKRMYAVGHSLENCLVFGRCSFLFSR